MPQQTQITVHRPTTPSLGTPLPPLVIGITGLMKIAPEDEPEVRRRLRDVFEWFRDGRLTIRRPEHNSASSADEDLSPLGLRKTPVLLLTSLAPGADHFAAELALNLGHQVRCPLPFAPAIYRTASTFQTEADRQSFDEILNQVNAQCTASGQAADPPTFVVHRPDDRKLDDKTFEALQLADVGNRERRNLRYRSAGDYISAHCDVLIAICEMTHEKDELKVDDELSAIAQPGAGYIVRTHLEGIEPGTLPFGTTLTWADNGPVLRIFCPKPLKDGEARDPAKSLLKTGEIAVWYPADSPIPFEFREEWHARRMKELRHFAGRLERLNQDLQKAGGAPADQESKMYQGSDPFKPKSFTDELFKNLKLLGNSFVGVFYPEVLKPSGNEIVDLSPLERIAALRRRVSDLNREVDSRVKAIIARAFWAFLTIVMLLQVYENWVPTGATGISWWRFGLFCVALSLFLFGVFRHLIFKRDGLFDRQCDYRAIAEGLRIQFYWLAAGIGRDASRDYLQRARGEFAWIREVIRWAGLPVESHARTFRQQTPQQRAKRLHDVCRGWLEEQSRYFGKSAFEQTSRNERIQFIGYLLLTAGLILVLCGFAVNAFGGTKIGNALDSIARFGGIWLLCGWLAFSAVFWLIADIARGALFRAWFEGNKRNRWVSFSNFLSSIQTQVFWAASLLLGWSFFSLVEAIAGNGIWPVTTSLLAIVKNLTLACGFLMLSWGAAKFAGENSRRYSAMRGLYRAADTKLKTLLARLDAAVAPTETEAFRLLEDAIQRYLIELGRESLQENTDWLTIHRNKPVEPLIPGG